MQTIFRWIKTHPYCLLLGYWLLFLPCFFLLERYATPIYILHSPIDEYIPMIEFFIIPYLLWFPLLALSLGYFLFHSKEDFQNLCFLMFSGLTISLLVYLFFPNGLDLRVTITRDNIFATIVKQLQGFDTPSNVCPSIHVASTLAITFAVVRYRKFSHPTLVKSSIIVLSVLIIASTMFLKQHSIIDVVAGIALTCVLYPITYHIAWRKLVFPRTLKLLIE